MIAAGYILLTRDAGADFAKTINRAFAGMGCVVAGAGLLFGALFFRK